MDDTQQWRARLQQYRIMISCAKKNILVERQWMSSNGWHTIDCYTTDDISKMPDKAAPWVNRVGRFMRAKIYGSIL